MALVKKIVKSIFPLAFLKEAFLIFNKTKIKTIDRVVFPEFKIKESEFTIYRSGYPFIESSINIEDLSNENVKLFMNDWYSWTQQEYLLHISFPCLIEPDHGWAIVGGRKLLYYSLGISRTLFQKKPAFLKLIRQKKVVTVDRVISLRDTGEENYFHFFNDVIAKLYFLEINGVDLSKAHILVSQSLWNRSYFQFYVEHNTRFQQLKWLIQQRDEYVYCKQSIFCKPLTHRLDVWERVFRAFPLPKEINGGRKIFLTRNKSRMRFLENSEGIECIAQNAGFEIVDTDGKTLAEQIDIFSNASLIIGIHGAGMTNMIFRNGPCKVLELFPPPESGYLPYHYIMLAKMKGFQYNAVIGQKSASPFSGGFVIDKVEFQAALGDLIGHKTKNI